MMTIIQALQKLDKSNDGHWTTQGLPVVEVVRVIMNDQTVTRKQITLADPTFTRIRDVPAESAVQNKPPVKTQEDIDAKIVELETVTAELETAIEKRQRPNLRELFRPASDSPDDITKAKNKCEAYLQSIGEEMAESQAHYDRANAFLGTLQELLFGKSSPRSDTEGRMRVIKSNGEHRKARVLETRRIRAAIGGTQNLDPRSLLDQKLSQKRATNSKYAPIIPKA